MHNKLVVTSNVNYFVPNTGIGFGGGAVMETEIMVEGMVH